VIAPNGRLDIAWYDFRHSTAPPVPSTGQGSERGTSDVYYASSSDKGHTVGPNIRVTDRSMDRSLGLWKFDSKFNVGITSANDAVYFAWQDPRNAIRETDADDVYSASVVLSGKTTESGSEGRGVPGWLLVAAGATVGAGLTMLLVGRMRGAGA